MAKNRILDTDKILGNKSIKDDQNLHKIEDMKPHQWKEFEQINKSWRDKHPYETSKDIGFWILKGWYEITESRAESSYCLRQKREYARLLFQDWLVQIKAGYRTQEEVELQEDRDFRNLELLFYDEDKIRPIKTEQELFEADIVQLSCGIRKSFKTEGFIDRPWYEKYVTTVLKGVVIKFGTVLAVTADLTLGSAYDVYKIAKHEWDMLRDSTLSPKERAKRIFPILIKDLSDALKNKWDKVSGIWEMGKAVFLDVGIRMALPTITLLIVHAFLPKIPLAFSLNSLFGKLLGFSTEGVLNYSVSFAFSYLIAGIISGIITNYVNQNRTKYEEFSDGLFTGSYTPEKVDLLYTDRLNKIMDDSSLDYEEMKKKMLDLHAEFQNNVRPAIERGLFYNRALEDQSLWDMFPKSDAVAAWLKKKLRSEIDKEKDSVKDKEVAELIGLPPMRKASSNKNSFVMEIFKVKFGEDIKAHLEEVMKSGEFSNTFYNVLSGKEKLSDEVRIMLKDNPSLVKDIEAQIKPHIEARV